MLQQRADFDASAGDVSEHIGQQSEAGSEVVGRVLCPAICGGISICSDPCGVEHPLIESDEQCLWSAVCGKQGEEGAEVAGGKDGVAGVPKGADEHFPAKLQDSRGADGKDVLTGQHQECLMFHPWVVLFIPCEADKAAIVFE